MRTEMEDRPFADSLLARLLYLLEIRSVETLGDLMRFTTLAADPGCRRILGHPLATGTVADTRRDTGAARPLTPAPSVPPASQGMPLPLGHPRRTSPARG